MRKVYILPNLVTTANMYCGFHSIIQSFHGQYRQAAWSILAASVFDALDGRIARMARATSEFGVEYDSLSDLVSFGVAPAMLCYLWALQSFDKFGWISAFLFCACAALRLARFNVTTQTLPKAFFQGLPVPISAGLVATFIVFQDAFIQSHGELIQKIALALTLALSGLMVSTVPFPSFKEVNWRSRAGGPILLAAMLALISILMKPELMLFVVILFYIFGSLVWNLVRISRGIKIQPTTEHNVQQP